MSSFAVLFLCHIVSSSWFSLAYSSAHEAEVTLLVLLLVLVHLGHHSRLLLLHVELWLLTREHWLLIHLAHTVAHHAWVESHLRHLLLHSTHLILVKHHWIRLEARIHLLLRHLWLESSDSDRFLSTLESLASLHHSKSLVVLHP